MFENFPYTDMHQLNLDWIVKIAKDFLEQYTHIQQLITDGETSLQTLTTSGLEQLQEKADALEALLNQWYTTHSADIANQLADALEDIQVTLNTAITNFNNAANAKAEQTIASIPSDYTELFNYTRMLWDSLTAEAVKGSISEPLTGITWQQGRIGDQGGIISGTNSPNYCMSSVLKNSSGAKRIDCSIITGWEFYITEHTSSTLSIATYVRHYPINKTPTGSDIIIFPTTGHRYTINLKKTDGTNFTPSDIPSNVITISVWTPTDKTLTVANAAADAKETGDKIDETEGHIDDLKAISFLTDYSLITRITSGDLDNYITPGTYTIPANVYTADIENMPIKAVGMLYVIKMASEAIYQIYMAYTSDGGSFYIRNKSSTAWRAWNRLAAEAEINHAFFTDYAKITRITDGDLNDYINPGTYSIAANSDTDNIDNMPVKSVGMLYIIKMASEAIYQMYMAYTTDGGSVYIRNKSSNDWRSWNKLSSIADMINAQKSRYNGKKVSIIGDSIETYVGYVVPGYRTSYPSLGLTSVDQTWWMQVINNSGAKLEVNAAFSGSMVTNNRQPDEYADYYPDLYERVSVIGSPDIVFVTLGTNDSNANIPLGDYDFQTTYTELNESTFRTAYIKGIKALQAAYPNAQIVCVSEYMKIVYRESIEYIAKQLGVEYINAYDYDRQSGSHPGVLGMQQIASLILYPTDLNLWQSHYPADAGATGSRIEALESKLPDTPVVDGSYHLTATVSNGSVTYSWSPET